MTLEELMWELVDEFDAHAKDRAVYGPLQRNIWTQASAKLANRLGRRLTDA